MGCIVSRPTGKSAPENVGARSPVLSIITNVEHGFTAAPGGIGYGPGVDHIGGFTRIGRVAGEYPHESEVMHGDHIFYPGDVVQVRRAGDGGKRPLHTV